MFAALTFAPVLQTDNNRTVRNTLSGNQSVASDSSILFYLRSALYHSLDFIDYFVGLFQCTTRCHTDIHHHNSLIFLRNQTGFGCRHQINEQSDTANQRSPHHPTVVDKEHHSFLIFTQHSIVRSIISGTHTSVDTFRTLSARSRTHHHSAQCRTKSQGANTGQANGSCHSDTELRIEDTGSTAHKSNGDKYRHKYTRTRDYRHRHIT